MACSSSATTAADACVITDSTLARNPSLGFETAGLPGIFYLGNGDAVVTGSSLS